MALGAPGYWGRSPSSAWRWCKSQRTFSLAQSAGVCSGSHWGRGGGQRPLRPRGTPSSAGSGWPHAEGSRRGTGSEGVPTGPWYPTWLRACSLTLPGRRHCTVPACHLDPGFPAPPPPRGPAPGTVGSSPHREASLLAESPFPGEFLVKSFPGHSVFSPLSYFCTGHGSGEGGPWRRADLVGFEERCQLMHPAV